MNISKKNFFKMLPTYFVTGVTSISAVLKISGHHPMNYHFREMGLSAQALGIAELIFIALFFFKATSRIGLLLLTAYFGAAIAAEIPYQMVLAPSIFLVFIWIAAFVRTPASFIANNNPDLQNQ